MFFPRTFSSIDCLLELAQLPMWLDWERHLSCKQVHAGANPVIGSGNWTACLDYINQQRKYLNKPIRSVAICWLVAMGNRCGESFWLTAKSEYMCREFEPHQCLQRCCSSMVEQCLIFTSSINFHTFYGVNVQQLLAWGLHCVVILHVMPNIWQIVLCVHLQVHHPTTS